MIENITHRSDSSDSENLLTEKDHQLLPHQRKTRRKKHHVAPLMVNLLDCKYAVVRQVVKNLKFKISKQLNSEWDLSWTDNIVSAQTLARMKPHQKINHFPAMFNLSRKNFLARNLNKMQKEFPQAYNFHPKTWTLPAQYNELKQHLQSQSNAVVIAKPEAGCQGRGIFLAKSIDQFSYGEHYVVQKYVKKPFLIEGLKFDLRVYVLVAGCDPLRIYIYKQGLARFATESYASPKRENLGNLYMHLTNYAINKSSSKFEYNQSSQRMDVGHKRSLSSILLKLKEMNHDPEPIWASICEIIVKTLISAQPILAHTYRSCQPDNIQNNMCFQVLGFDVMLDSDLKPIILQVNYTPSFATDTPLDLRIKQGLLTDTLLLLNLSNKTKNDALAAKKREMMERTLTGKKIWYTREERRSLLDKINAKRDAWELSHLGNFERAYPLLQGGRHDWQPRDRKTSQRLQGQGFMGQGQRGVGKGQREVDQRGGGCRESGQGEGPRQLGLRYGSYLTFSQACYISATGGDIKRNNKISLQMANAHTTNDLAQVLRPPKYTKNDQLQRIYMKKSKPMIYQKIKSNSSQIKQQDPQREPIADSRHLSNTRHLNNRSHLDNPKPRGEHAKVTDYQSNQKSTVKFTNQGRSSTADRMAKEMERRNGSVRNGKVVLSRIYNIGFREMKPAR